MMFSMSSYLYVSVSFMQIMKSFSPAIVLLVLAASGVERPTVKSSASVLVMCIGILITATGEVNFSLPGFTLLLLGQICEAIRLVMMQRFITRLNFKAIELQYYRAPAAAGTLLIFAVFMESGSIWRSSGYELFVQHVHIFVFQSILGLCVNISKILVLKVTNSVTLKVITVVRNAALVFINMAFFGEVVTSRQVAGYGLLLAAFSVFQYFRWEQASAARAKASV